MKKSVFSKWVSYLFIFSFLLSVTATRAQDNSDYYDEVFEVKPTDTSPGVVRPQYRAVWGEYMKTSEKKKKRFWREAAGDLKKDNPVSPLLRLLVKSEDSFLDRGTVQRGLAIQKFLEDYYAGKKTYERIIPKEIVERIVKRNNSEGLAEFVNPAQISMPFGIDLVRGENGQFYVLEDNPGYVGGQGDIVQVRESFKKRYPEAIKAAQPLDNPEKFFDEFLEAIRRKIGPDGKIIFATQNTVATDHEDRRLEKIYRERGIEIFDPLNRDAELNGNKMKIKKNGVFIKKKARKTTPKSISLS